MNSVRYYRQYRPSAFLSELIECYWVFRVLADSREVDRLIPGGRVEMMFHFGACFQMLPRPDAETGDTGSGVYFMGQRNKVFYGRLIGASDILGVRFKPGGLSAFTGLPLLELLNRLVPGAAVLGDEVGQWLQQLAFLQGDDQRIPLLDRLLSGLVERRKEKHWLSQDRQTLGAVLSGISAYPDMTDVQGICDQTGWYYKKLERVFQRTVGYAPKQYLRIVRFNKAIRRMETGKDGSLTSVAYESGYYDQSHFIKDFSHFAGTAPGDFPFGDHSMAAILIHHQPV